MRTALLLFIIALLSASLIVAEDRIPMKDWKSDKLYDFEYFLGPLGAVGVLKFSDTGDFIEVSKISSPGILEKTDIHVGDKIIGYGGERFKKGTHAVYSLMEGFDIANEPKKATFELLVMRGEEELRIVAEFRGTELKYSDTAPANCKRTRLMIDKAFTWLGNKKTVYDGVGLACKDKNNSRVVVSAVVGLAFLADGNTTKKGKYSDALKKCERTVVSQIGKEGYVPDPSWSQVNWGLAFGTVFLAELYAATKDEKFAGQLEKLAKQISDNQKESGGWAHGIGGMNALNYCELNIVGAWCVLALVSCKKAGIKVDDKVIEKGIAYFEKSTPQYGGLGYSADNKTADAARSTPALLAFQAMGIMDSAYPKALGEHFKANLGELRTGHGIPTMHTGLGAMVCANMNEQVWGDFWKMYRYSILSANQPEGHFLWFPSRENRSIPNGDRDLGPAWTTAWNLLMLLAPQSKLRLVSVPPHKYEGEEEK